MVRTPDVSILGAGLVGSLLATLLAQRGMSVTVYEKRPDMRRTTIIAGRSINLALSERGIHAMKQARVFRQIEPQLVPMRGRLLHHEDGSVESQPYGWRADEQIYSVSRGELNKSLMTAAEQLDNVKIEFEMPCGHVDLQRQKIVVGEGSSRVEQSYHMLIGADGAGSVLRPAIAAATAGQESTDFLDHGYKELSIPAGDADRYQLEPNMLHIWPRGGFMLIALPNLDGSFTLTLFLANQGDCSFASLASDESAQAFFATRFPDALSLMPSFLHDFHENPVGLLGTVRCWPWHYPSTALLIGDAAHAIVPFHGQGMNCGFEDCVALMRLWDTSQSWECTLERFGFQRKPNADAIAEMALENYLVMRDHVLDPKFHLRKLVEFELERRFPDRFIPRYSMVMFHSIPYADAFSRGEIQSRLLDELVEHVDDVAAVNWDHAGRQVQTWLTPLEFHR